MNPNPTKIPHNPGCYIFLDDVKNIIYVGKAKDLKKRVSSYFNRKDLDVKTQAMLAQAKDIDFIITNNEIEALILENNLIKKNTPKYNIDLKDSKRYAYLEIVKEKFPRLLLARKTKSEGKLFGPFTSAQKRDYVKDVLTKNFKIRTCTKFPKKPCLRYHIGICDAPCAGKQSEEKYNENIRAVEMILKGKSNQILKILDKRMRNASNTQDFERSLEFREQIKAIKWLNEKQNMERQKQYNEDIINYIVKKDKIYLMLFNIHEGILENKKDFEFSYIENFLEEFLVQYYSEAVVPKEIILPREIDESIAKFLEKISNQKVIISMPQKGEKKELLELVKKNIEIQFFREKEKLEDLQKKINLEEIPEVIECFDVSHLSGTSSVASMVQFRGAIPDKSNYRRFKLKTIEGIDDFAAMAEVVRRRYYKLVQEKSQLPNLIVIDGGIGQLSYAIKELEKLDVKVPIISLAKKQEEIYIPGKSKPIKLDKKSKGLLLLIAIRDEAHRFAIKYNRLLRSKKLVEK